MGPGSIRTTWMWVRVVLAAAEIQGAHSIIDLMDGPLLVSSGVARLYHLDGTGAPEEGTDTEQCATA